MPANTGEAGAIHRVACFAGTPAPTEVPNALEHSHKKTALLKAVFFACISAGISILKGRSADQSTFSNFKSQTPWPNRSPRRSNLVIGRSSGRGT